MTKQDREKLLKKYTCYWNEGVKKKWLNKKPKK